MTLPTPPKYVVVPAEAIDQAFATEKPRRALLATFIRILSLAWESKYQQTPRMQEDELWVFLRLSRRQYFEQKSEMESLGWLRSSHPVAGFVQFSFSRVASEVAASAEKRSEMLKTAPELRRIEEEDSLNLIKNQDPPPPSSEEKQVRKIALISGAKQTVLDDGNPKLRLFVQHLPLLFDPEIHSVLEWRNEFAVGLPDRVLGWIAKAYQDRERLVQGGGPIGLIVKHITQQDAPPAYYLNNTLKILPDVFLEAVEEIEFECAYCRESFATRDLRQAHQQAAHPYPCEECAPVCFFADDEARRQHWRETHDPLRVRPATEVAIISIPVLEGSWSLDKLWQAVLGTLQLEMPRASFDTWVRDSQLVRYDGNGLTVFVRNSYARDWLTNRLTARVNGILSQLLSKPTTVTFTTEEAES